MHIAIHPPLWISESGSRAIERNHMRITTTQQQQQQPAAAVVVCLQAQHVAGLPAAAEGRQVLLRLLQQQQPATNRAGAAAAVCEGGVAAFRDQVLLLDCAPTVSSRSVVGVAVTVDDDGRSGAAAVVDVDLAEQLRRPSPRALSFAIGGGAVLSLTLHHRPVVAQRRRRQYSVSGCNYCMAAADLVLSCLRVPLPTGGPPAGAGGGGVGHRHEDESSSSSSGFITIEKGTISISRQRPPSDNMLSTDEEVEEKEEEEEIRKVEEEFLAMLDADDLLDLDALIKDAEAEVAASKLGRPDIYCN